MGAVGFTAKHGTRSPRDCAGVVGNYSAGPGYSHSWAKSEPLTKGKLGRQWVYIVLWKQNSHFAFKHRTYEEAAEAGRENGESRKSRGSQAKQCVVN